MSARKIMMATATARTICVTVIGVLAWLRILRTHPFLYVIVLVPYVSIRTVPPDG